MSEGRRGRSHSPFGGRSITGTRDAASRAVDSGSATPITSNTGPMVERPGWMVSCFCAACITGRCMRRDSGWPSRTTAGSIFVGLTDGHSPMLPRRPYTGRTRSGLWKRSTRGWTSVSIPGHLPACGKVSPSTWAWRSRCSEIGERSGGPLRSQSCGQPMRAWSFLVMPQMPRSKMLLGELNTALATTVGHYFPEDDFDLLSTVEGILSQREIQVFREAISLVIALLETGATLKHPLLGRLGMPRQRQIESSRGRSPFLPRRDEDSSPPPGPGCPVDRSSYCAPDETRVDPKTPAAV